MTDTVQDFSVFAGDACQPQILVTDGDGNPIPLDGLDEVIWLIFETVNSTTALLTKRLSDGTLSLPGGGAQSIIVPNIVKADLLTLKGYYFHKAKLFDGSDEPSTVTLGTIRIRPNMGGS